ncbi:MAG: hypothetical protein AAB557_05330 [Patescibacteria group bacterium]
MSTQYFLVAGCGSGKECYKKVVALSGPPNTPLDEVENSRLCLCHADQFLIRSTLDESEEEVEAESGSSCSPYRVLVACEIKSGTPGDRAKDIALKRANVLFDRAFSSSDGK